MPKQTEKGAVKPKKYGKAKKTDDAGALADIAAAGAGFEKLSQLAAEIGLPENFARAVRRRLERKHLSAYEKVRAQTSKERLNELEKKHALALSFLDPCVLAEASARDLAYITELLHRQIQLESGRPTQIMSVQERKNLDDLLPALIQEAERRGVTLDVPFTVEHDDPCQDDRPSTNIPELA